MHRGMFFFPPFLGYCGLFRLTGFVCVYVSTCLFPPNLFAISQGGVWPGRSGDLSISRCGELDCSLIARPIRTFGLLDLDTVA